MTVAADNRGATPATASIFARVLVGVDGSPQGLEAALQAARLLDAGGTLTLLAVYDVEPTLVGGVGGGVPTYLYEDFQREKAEEALQAVREEIPVGISLETRTVRGCSWNELIREAERAHDTLLAVGGSHRRSRAMGITLGSTATEVAHKARCSILIARGSEPTFPRAILVGVDGRGSPCSRRRLPSSSGSDIGHRCRPSLRRARSLSTSTAWRSFGAASKRPSQP